VPCDEDLKNRVIFENHDPTTAGHPGWYKTYILAQAKYCWLRMHRDIQRYVATCEQCQRNKARQTKPPRLLQSLAIPAARWCDITMDFLVALPTTESSFDAIFVICDRMSKRIVLIPTKTTATAEDTARLFLRNYVKYHGLPKSIVSDRDTKFTSTFWTTLMKMFQTKYNLSSAFRPQTDGQTE